MTTRRRKPVNPDDHWHIQRNIPVALLIGLALQAGAAIWWGSGVDKDIQELKSDFRTMQVKADRRDTKLDGLVALKSELKHIADILGRLERTVDRLQFGSSPQNPKPQARRRR